MQAKFDYAAVILVLDKSQRLERRQQRVQQFTPPWFFCNASLPRSYLRDHPHWRVDASRIRWSYPPRRSESSWTLLSWGSLSSSYRPDACHRDQYGGI